MPHPKQLREAPNAGAEYPTMDRGPDAEERYHAPERLGAVQRLTPEGYLLCLGVPVARLGTLLYVANEMRKLQAGRDGLIRVLRDEHGLFNPEAMRSFEGKPVTDGHPPEWVTPANWKRFAVGTMQNVRRGEGAQDGLLLADLLITDAAAIAAVRAGKREVSLGYDARYEQDEPGAARQTITKGNHLALVRSGRCGTTCSIGDEDMTKKRTWADRIRTAFRAQDEAALNEELENAPSVQTEDGAAGETHHVVIEVKATPGEVAPAAPAASAPPEPNAAEQTVDATATLAETVAALADRLTAIESALKPSAPTTDAQPGEAAPVAPEPAAAAANAEEAQTADSAALQDEFTATLSRAEILVPGIALPTFDAAAPAATTQAQLRALRQTALTTIGATQEGQAVIATFDAAPNVPAMNDDALRVLFNAASESVKAANNKKAAERQTRDAAAPTPGVIHSPAELNARARQRWTRAA